MPVLNLYKRTVVIGAMACITMSGCVSPRPAQRFLGFQETINLGSKQLFTGTSLSQQDQLVNKAAIQRLGQRVSETMTTTVELPGFETAIVRREQHVGSFELNFGKSADFTFSIQPCKHIVTKDLFLTCADPSARPPLTISKSLQLIGGQQVSVQFANGVVWNYRVLDQNSPFVD